MGTRRKTVALLAALVMLMSLLVACSAAEEASAAPSASAVQQETAAAAASEENSAPAQAGHDLLGEHPALVAYFSATGRTRQAAEGIAQQIGAELFEIEPEEHYTEADLDYGNDDSRSSQEVRDESSRPAIAREPEDIRQYEVVYLGYPIWWGKAPPIIRTFLDANDLAGMKVVPFCTSGSSGITESEDALRSEYPDIDWQKGMRIADPAGELKMSEWVDELGLWPFGE